MIASVKRAQFKFGKCRDVVPKWGRVAHDEIHNVSPLDCADADGNDAACFSRWLASRGARRYHEPRHLLLATQGLIQVAAAALSVLTWTSLMNSPLLLGLGAILGNLAWQAINAELVPAAELPAAVTLSSVSYYLARAVGPIHGGPSTFSAPCRRCAACAIEMVPSVGSLRVILNMKSVISRHSWQSRGWIISGSLIA
jgi:transmembrane secretion effector